MSVDMRAAPTAAVKVRGCADKTCLKTYYQHDSQVRGDGQRQRGMIVRAACFFKWTL